MRASFRASNILRVTAAAAGLWLGGAGAAWAGDGADLGSLQALLSGTGGLCQIFNISSCPHVPTITQGVLEVAGLGNNLPEMVRAQNNIPPGGAVSADNPAIGTAPSTISELLPTLTPLAFISQSSGTAPATQLYDRSADSFLYAVAVSTSGFPSPIGLPVPDTAFFVYDDLFRNNVNFATGTTVAKFSLPLTVLNGDGSERAVPTTLNFIANNIGDCSTSTVSGSFSDQLPGPQPLPAAQIGITCSVVFGASPTSTQKHVIFQVAVPLLVTALPNTDPAYFYTDLHSGEPNPVNTGVFTAFIFNEKGQPATRGNLGTGVSIGLAPSAGPLGQPPAAGSTPFALCASLPVNNDNKLRPAVGAYYAIATSGEMLLSAPLSGGTETGQGIPSACPPL